MKMEEVSAEEQAARKEKKKDSIWKHIKFKCKNYKDAEELWEDAKLYFDWCDNNPVDAPISVVRYKKEKHGGSKEMKRQDQQENVSRPYTLYGLCAFLGIRSWSSFKKKFIDNEYFEDVFAAIENVITSQQVDGAMTGVFKENLTCRLNGLVDKVAAEVDVDAEIGVNHKFTGFGFLPWTPGLQNSENTRIASGQMTEIPDRNRYEEEPIIDYAEIVDELPITKEQERPIELSFDPIPDVIQ